MLLLGGDFWCVLLRGQHPEARGHLSEALTEDTGVGNSVAGSPLPLTTGNENLDVAIVIHLQYCNHLIQVRAPSDFSKQMSLTNVLFWQHQTVQSIKPKIQSNVLLTLHVF